MPYEIYAGYEGYSSVTKTTRWSKKSHKWDSETKYIRADLTAPVSARGEDSDLFDTQKAAGHDFTVNDEGVAFCKHCGDFMTFPAKPCSALQQPPAPEVDLDSLAGNIVNAMWQYKLHDKYINHTIALKIVQYLAANGHIVTGKV